MCGGRDAENAVEVVAQIHRGAQSGIGGNAIHGGGGW